MPPADKHPDFERFLRAITTDGPGPVTVGDIFADPDTVANYIPLNNYLAMLDQGRKYNQEHFGCE